MVEMTLMKSPIASSNNQHVFLVFLQVEKLAQVQLRWIFFVVEVHEIVLLMVPNISLSKFCPG